MDTIYLTKFLEVARSVGKQSKITEHAAIIVCLVLVLAMISLLMLLLWWLRVIIFLVLLFRITQMYSGSVKGGVQALVHRHKPSGVQLEPRQIVELDDKGGAGILASHEDISITMGKPRHG